MPTDPTPPPPDIVGLRRKCFALAKGLGLDDDQRHELSVLIPGIDPDRGPFGWRHFSFDQLARLCDYLCGAVYVEKIQRDRATREAYEQLMRRQPSTPPENEQP